jgi:protein involved in polysaccharide export with SLBB domain
MFIVKGLNMRQMARMVVSVVLLCSFSWQLVWGATLADLQQGAGTQPLPSTQMLQQLTPELREKYLHDAINQKSEIKQGVVPVQKDDSEAKRPAPSDDNTESVSRIESAFAKKTVTLLDKLEHRLLVRQLKQFGYDFFANTAQLAAIDTLPDSGDYQVGPGDILNLRVWGGVDLQLELAVDRNGNLAIPKVGTVNVAGMTLDQARSAVRSALGSYFRDFEMNLSMARLSSVQVYLVGEVQNPGRYAVSSFGTVINALAAAGGPSRNGSLRTIKVTRGSKQIAVVDLYDMLLRGDRSQDLRLQNGDTIFVPVIGPVVAVAGEVKRPAIYEIKGETSLEDVLTMAGGVSANGYMGRIQVERIKDNQSRIVLDYVVKGMDEAKLLSSTVMQDQDMVKVFPVEEAIRQVVTLKGNVVRPGEYQLRKGMRLSDIIPSTAALLPESYLDSVEISRLSPPDWRRELVTVNLRRALAGNEADNLLLQEQDSIRVFSRWEMEEKPKVAINGAVVTPGTYDFYPGMTVRDLVTAAGSPRRYAYLDQAELSRIIVGKEKAAWTRIPFDLGRAMAGDSSQNLALQQDDVLIVRTISEWHDATERLVTLKGEVRYPGVYTIARGEKLDAVIRRAGGYTDKAYLRGAKFTRASVRALQQQRMDEMLSRTEQQVMRKQR